MFGIDDLAIASMIASAAIQQQTRAAAADRQRKAAVQSQQRAIASQNQATDVALKQVQEFDPTVRKDKQDEIQQDLTSQYEKAGTSAPITAQGVQVGATISDAAGTTDYLTAKAKEAAKAAASNRNLAALFGRLGAPGELRRGEAVGIGDAAGDIGRIQTGANNVANIDQIGIKAAGQPSLGGMLVSSALGAYGMGRASLPTAAVKSAPNILAGSYANPNVLQVGSWLRK